MFIARLRLTIDTVKIPVGFTAKTPLDSHKGLSAFSKF